MCRNICQSLLILLFCGISQTAFAQNNIWISDEELAALPTSGAAWEQIRSIAFSDFGTAQGGHNDNHDVKTLAQALVAARLNDNNLKDKVADNLLSAIGTENNGNSLSISRNLAAYVLAADIIDFRSFDSGRESRFRDWVERMITIEHNSGGCGPSGCSIPAKHEDRPNNHGTMAGASRAAAAIYLGDNAELARTAQVFKGYLGDRSSYSGFNYGDLSWQENPSSPVGINPVGATKEGHNIDGVMPDDMRRGGGFTWPPSYTGYVWEGLQGAVVQAEILYRAGYDTWNWEDKALLRAVRFLYSIDWPAQGDDAYVLYLINNRYGTNFPTSSPAGHGKNMGWTDWTHTSSGGSGTNEETTRIEGNIRNEDDGAAIDGAKIQLKSGDSILYETQSNSLGHYSFIDINAGTYELFCTKSGFSDFTKEVTVAENQQLLGQDIALTPIADTEPPAPPQNVDVVTSE